MLFSIMLCVLFMANFFSLGGDVPIDTEALFMTDFLNLKIKPSQSFECAHRSMVQQDCYIWMIGTSWMTTSC
jgi:hypothetical protein